MPISPLASLTRLRGIGTVVPVLALGLSMFAVGRGTAEPVAGEIAEDSLQGKTLTFASFGGIYQDAQIAALDGFIGTSGVTLFSVGPVTLPEIEHQVRTGDVRWDVVNTSELLPLAQCGRLFQRLDFSKIDISQLPEGQVDDCSVPAMNAGVIMLYDRAKFPDGGPASWTDFFDTERFPGKRAAPGLTEAAPYLVEIALLADGQPRHGTFFADIDRALEKWRELRPSLRLWLNGAESQQIIETGAVDIVIVWSARGRAAVESGADYVPVWQDWVAFKDRLAIPIGVRDPDAAYALINYYLGAQAQEILSERTSYAPVNLITVPEMIGSAKQFQLDTAERRALAYYPHMDYWAEHYGELTEKWTRYLHEYPGMEPAVVSRDGAR